jgi:hypothetical protein
MAKASPIVLDLNQLQAGIPALTPALGQVHAEAAALCLDNQGHPASVALYVRKQKGSFQLVRQAVSKQMKQAYLDMIRTTELGACGIALLLVIQITGKTAIKQSRRGTGFDYWIGSPDQTGAALPFQDSARLEVSGIL